MVDRHDHLDRRRRPRGECPGCDTIWDAQDAWLTRNASRLATIAQLERMGDRQSDKKDDRP